MFIKVSQLPNIPSIGPVDLFEISKHNGDNTYTSFNVTTGQLSQFFSSSVVMGSNLNSGGISGSLFSGNPKSFSVNLIPSMLDNSYSITITGEDLRIWSITNKIPGGFTISSNSNRPLSGTVWWRVELL